MRCFTILKAALAKQSGLPEYTQKLLLLTAAPFRFLTLWAFNKVCTVCMMIEWQGVCGLIVT
jgi:hypothetical protein